jgi:hypothetical protein
MGVQWHYRILISPNDFNRAKEVLGIDAPQNTIPSSDSDDEEVFDPAYELPDTSASLISEPKRRDTYLTLGIPKTLLPRCGLRTLTTSPSRLNTLLTKIAFIAGAIPISPTKRKSSYGLKTNPLPAKSSVKSSKALPSSS